MPTMHHKRKIIIIFIAPFAHPIVVSSTFSEIRLFVHSKFKIGNKLISQGIASLLLRAFSTKPFFSFLFSVPFILQRRRWRRRQRLSSDNPLSWFGCTTRTRWLLVIMETNRLNWWETVKDVGGQTVSVWILSVKCNIAGLFMCLCVDAFILIMYADPHDIIHTNGIQLPKNETHNMVYFNFLASEFFCYRVNTIT